MLYGRSYFCLADATELVPQWNGFSDPETDIINYEWSLVDETGRFWYGPILVSKLTFTGGYPRGLKLGLPETGLMFFGVLNVTNTVGGVGTYQSEPFTQDCSNPVATNMIERPWPFVIFPIQPGSGDPLISFKQPPSADAPITDGAGTLPTDPAYETLAAQQKYYGVPWVDGLYRFRIRSDVWDPGE